MEWHKVTWYSTVLAVVLFIGVYVLGFYMGDMYGQRNEAAVVAPNEGTITQSNAIISDVTFSCDGKKTAHAIFHKYDVQLLLSDGRNLTEPHALSADGGRYANADESFVFWTKGNGAFITEGSSTTYANCKVMPEPI